VPTMREGVAIAAVIVGSAVLSAVSHHAGGQATHARMTVQTAAERFTPDQVGDAWMQARLGDPTRLGEIVHTVPLRYRSTHQEGDTIIVAFTGPNGHCVDLLSRPDANTVRTRRC